MAENVKVVVRCRPMNKKEHEEKCRNIIDIENCSVFVQNPSDLNAPAKTFTYDSVYDPLAPTEALYNDICYSLVDNVLEGYNGTIFAYGQTGCGKTHTMQGPDVSDDNAMSVPTSQRGIISRTFDHIFEAISVASGVRYLALVSYLEIYNESIRDLLNPNESINANHPLKELPGVGVVVPTIGTHTVHDANECHQLLGLGNRNRMVGATLMNASSSRSHSIFTISLEQIHNEEDSPHTAHNDHDDVVAAVSGIRRGKLNLVDLAGSERQNKTGAVGERLKEATKINLSLSALGNVISALVDGKTKHIPYRDSKLTRLLQDSLGGNTKTLMISCISPADNSYDETLSTLRYASRAKNISNKPRINEDPKDAKLREYQDEILKLKKLLSNSHASSQVPAALPSQLNDELQHELVGGEESTQQRWLVAERTKLQAEMNAEMQRLKEQHTAEQREKDEQMQEMQALRQSYEQQLRRLAKTTGAGDGTTVTGDSNDPDDASRPVATPTATATATATATLQLEARKRIELIKKALIGGERANDTQLKERRQKKKLDAQRRLSALAHVLSRVEQSEDRDLLQGHYTNIQQELNAKNEYLKAYRQKIKALEREVSDLQSEFQLDRADYLETIRRLERNLKFYQQIMDKALPILRKDGKYWDPNEIQQNSAWNDDLKVWKLPETAMNTFRLPPATSTALSNSKLYFENSAPMALRSTTTNGDMLLSTHNGTDEHDMYAEDVEGAEDEASRLHRAHEEAHNNKMDILHNYFRSTRQKTADHMRMAHPRKGFSYWKDIAQRSAQPIPQPQQQPLHVASPFVLAGNPSQTPLAASTYFSGKHLNVTPIVSPVTEGRALSSWLPEQHPHSRRSLLLNQTWGGADGDRLLTASLKRDQMRGIAESMPGMEYIFKARSQPTTTTTTTTNATPSHHPAQRLSPATAAAGTQQATFAPAEPYSLQLHALQQRRPHKLAAINYAPSESST